MPDRTPLQPLPPEERAEKLKAMGLDENMVPLNASVAEKVAASGGPAHRLANFTLPHLPPWALKAAQLAAALGTVLPVLPMLGAPGWVSFVVFAVACAGAFATGAHMPSWVGPTLLRPGLVTAVGLGAGGVAAASEHADGSLRGWLLLAATLLAGAAGKTLEQPTAPAAGNPPAP